MTATVAESASATVTSPISAAQPATIQVPDVSGMDHQDAMRVARLYNLREVDSSGISG
ncbi:hypothetical protein ACFPN7_48420 [Amycolatopsis halotolerans]|uniref:hypothetical protein n=1 Tax=Amycolatopsis halotolerans TaxID=330083 RepID=UPI00362389F5